MSKFATPNRFEDDGTRGSSGEVLGGSWYKPPPRLFRPDGGFSEMWPDRVRVFRELTGLVPAAPRSNAGPKVLVAGCGYGFVVWHLWDQGFAAYGVDTPYAWSQARSAGGGAGLLPNIGDTNIQQGDCTVRGDMIATRSFAGITGNRRYDAVITDDLLSAADSGAEAQAMLTQIRNETAPNDRSKVVHFISMYEPGQPWSPRLTPAEVNEGLYRSPAEWITLIGTTGTAANERIVNIQNGHGVVR